MHAARRLATASNRLRNVGGEDDDDDDDGGRKAPRFSRLSSFSQRALVLRRTLRGTSERTFVRSLARSCKSSLRSIGGF